MISTAIIPTCHMIPLSYAQYALGGPRRIINNTKKLSIARVGLVPLDLPSISNFFGGSGESLSPTVEATAKSVTKVNKMSDYKVVTAPELRATNAADGEIDDDDDEDAIVKEMHNQSTLRMAAFVLQNLASLAVTGFLLYSLFMMLRIANSGGAARNAMQNFTKVNAKVFDENNAPPSVKFEDVAGLEAAKREVFELVDFLKNPERYSKLGASIPKGYLLVGPPGTGKTMLAQAIAGEAGVPFISVSASSFVEMFVGVGASKVRDLFAKAKELAPCIVFIDEIDAVGKARGGPGGMMGGNDEREQTINQLLTEMNGFEPNNGVIVIAATNRPDILDKALLRPGRFDRQVTVGLPDAKGRKEILGVHTRGKPLADNVDFDVISRVTPGFSGADLMQLANEAAIYAARANRDNIISRDFDEALEKITIGLERDGAILSQNKRRVVAYHEAGHALCAAMLDDYDEIKKVTITPRGGTGGVTQFLPSSEMMDSGLYTRDYFEKQLIVALGGRAAEEIVFGKDKITTGASGDMKRVYEIARLMVTQYGFSERAGTVMWMYDASSTEIAACIDNEILRMAKKAYASALELMELNREALDAVAEALLQKETLNGEEVVSIINSI